MPVIGKKWGVVLAPRGKMPQPVPPSADLKQIFERLKNTVRIVSKKNPTVNAPVGTEDMSPSDIAENIMAVLEYIKSKIKRPLENICIIYVKTTMGEAGPVEAKAS